MPSDKSFFEEKSFNKLIKRKRKSGYAIFGITGHSDLLNNDLEETRERLKDKLEEIKKYNSKAVLVSALASGSDQLFCKCFEEVYKENGELFFLRILPENVLLESTFNGYTTFKPSIKNKSAKPNIYYEITSEKTKITYIKNIDTPNDAFEYYIEKSNLKSLNSFQFYESEEQTFNHDQRDDKFAELGNLLVKYSDRLFALWDGVYGYGKGGTGYTVSQWSSTVSNKDKYLHQLSIKRKSNLFPVKRKFIDPSYDNEEDYISSFSDKPEWTDSKFSKTKAPLLYGKSGQSEPPIPV